MGKELCIVIDQMSREKGISREALLQVLESALLSAARKRFGSRTNVVLRVDRKTCEIQLFDVKTVVEEVANPAEEISLSDAREQYPDKNLADNIEAPIRRPPKRPIICYKVLLKPLKAMLKTT